MTHTLMGGEEGKVYGGEQVVMTTALRGGTEMAILTMQTAECTERVTVRF